MTPTLPGRLGRLITLSPPRTTRTEKLDRRQDGQLLRDQPRRGSGPDHCWSPPDVLSGLWPSAHHDRSPEPQLLCRDQRESPRPVDLTPRAPETSGQEADQRGNQDVRLVRPADATTSLRGANIHQVG